MFEHAAGRWRLEPVAWGMGNQLMPLMGGTVHTRGNEGVIDRGALIEWYRNGPLGIQQGFTVYGLPQQTLASTGQALGLGLGNSSIATVFRSAVNDGAAPLRIIMRQSGTLHAAAGDGVSASVLDEAGRVVLQYGRLIAFDARGRFLPTAVEIHGDTLCLSVDTRGAHFPVVVDPFVQSATLAPSDGAAGDLFGTSVAAYFDAILGSVTVVVGSWKADGTAGVDQGKAYVFQGNLGTIGEVGILTASDAQPNDQFGRAVDIDGDTIVVAAFMADVGANTDQGAVYVFEKPVGGWTSMTETAKLWASDGLAGDKLGRSVAISNDTIVAGAYQADVGVNPDQGAAYVFVKTGGGWVSGTETAKLTTSSGGAGDMFGIDVDTDSTVIAVGAYFADIGANSDQGAVYVFERPGGGWATTNTENGKLTASDGASGDRLGLSVAVDGNVVASGAYQADVAGNHDAGAVYVFEKPGPTWADMTQTAKLVASTPETDAWLGFDVAIQGDALIAGAPYQNAPDKPGAAYVFKKAGASWVDGTESEVLVDNAAQSDQLAGISVAVDSNLIVVGAPQADVDARTDQGLVFVFTSCGNAIVEPGELCDPGPDRTSALCCSADCSIAGLPSCISGAALFELPSAALSRLRIGAGSSVVGGACLTTARLGEGAQLQGSLFADSSASKAAIRLGKNATVTGTCTTGGAPVSLGSGAMCNGGTDTSGMSACSIPDLAESRRSALQALPANLALTSPLRVKVDQTFNVAGMGPVVIVEAPSLSVAGGKTLTIAGDSSTGAVIFRVAGKLAVGKLGKILLTGIPPGPGGSSAERILFLVGTGARFGKQSVVNGTILAQKSGSIGAGAQLEGAVGSARNVRVGANATVTNRDLAFW